MPRKCIILFSEKTQWRAWSCSYQRTRQTWTRCMCHFEWSVPKRWWGQTDSREDKIILLVIEAPQSWASRKQAFPVLSNPLHWTEKGRNSDWELLTTRPILVDKRNCFRRTEKCYGMVPSLHRKKCARLQRPYFAWIRSKARQWNPRTNCGDHIRVFSLLWRDFSLTREMILCLTYHWNCTRIITW